MASLSSQLSSEISSTKTQLSSEISSFKTGLIAPLTGFMGDTLNIFVRIYEIFYMFTALTGDSQYERLIASAIAHLHVISGL